jgi:hypothetical protein
MAKSTTFKRVTVKEDAKTTLEAAGIHPLTLPDGAKAVALAGVNYPYHDRPLFDKVCDALAQIKPDVIFLLGCAVAEEAFKSTWDQEDNILHKFKEVPEVVEATEAGIFDDRIMTLADRCRTDFFERLGRLTKKVVYIPSATHLSLGNEVRLLEWIRFTKRYLDGWMLKHPDTSDTVADPMVKLPTDDVGQLFGLRGNPKFFVTEPGAGVLVNKNLLFLVGDYKRRHAGDHSFIEWEQRDVSVVVGFDFKVASWWMNHADHTLPGLRQLPVQGHEIGGMYNYIYMAHYRDYDRRAQGFWKGTVAYGKMHGRSIYVRRGEDGRRSFVLDGVAYTEDQPGCVGCREEVVIPSDADVATLGTPEGISSRPETGAMWSSPADLSDAFHETLANDLSYPATLGTREGMSSLPPDLPKPTKGKAPKAKSKKAKKTKAPKIGRDKKRGKR